MVEASTCCRGGVCAVPSFSKVIRLIGQHMRSCESLSFSFLKVPVPVPVCLCLYARACARAVVLFWMLLGHPVFWSGVCESLATLFKP